MKTRHSILAGGLIVSASVAIGACATSDPSPPAPIPENVIPAGDADADGAGEAGDAGPCIDCEYFPETCSGEILCSNGLFETDGELNPRAQINFIRGRSESDVWVGGALGVLAHFDGKSWTSSDIGKRETIAGIWLGDSAEMALVSLDTLYSRGLDVPDGSVPSAGGWTLRDTPPFPDDYEWWGRNLVSAWAAPGSEWVWGATWAVQCDSPACFIDDTLRTSGVWRIRISPSLEIVDAIGSDMCQAISCRGMSSIHGWSASDIWAVGAMGSALRISSAESETPTIRTFDTQTWNALYGVWAASESDAWAVGAHGVVRHYSGNRTRWEVVSDVPTTNDLFAVWGSSPSDVWAVGDAATVLHYDGKSWSRVKIGGLGNRRPKLTAVWAPSPGHVWIGGQGVVLSLGGKP